MPPLTHVTFHELHYRPKSSLLQPNPGSQESWISENLVLQSKGGSVGGEGGLQEILRPRTTKSTRLCKCYGSFSAQLTLHWRARGLSEQWNKQQIDEIDEGQGVVPEQASCRETERNMFWSQQKTTITTVISQLQRGWSHSCPKGGSEQHCLFNDQPLDLFLWPAVKCESFMGLTFVLKYNKTQKIWKCYGRQLSVCVDRGHIRLTERFYVSHIVQLCSFFCEDFILQKYLEAFQIRSDHLHHSVTKNSSFHEKTKSFDDIF